MVKSKSAGIRERFVASGGAISGGLSFLGSYQVCHNLCMGIITILAGMGIVLKGMPLLFLNKIAMPFWIAAVVVLVAMTVMKLQKKICLSRNTLLFNSGLIIAGIPFRSLQDYTLYFWVIGGTIVLISIAIFIVNRISFKTLLRFTK